MTGDGSGDCREQGGRASDEPDESPSEPEQFRLGDLVDVVSHPTRRAVLTRLESRDSAVPLTELAEQISPRWGATDPLRRSDDRPHPVKMQLYHVHLPKLDEEGLVAFDRQELTVAITEDGEEAVRRLF